MRIILPLFLAAFLVACKKDKLEGDTAFLIGEWKWIATKETIVGVPSQHIWHYDSTSTNSYKLVFREKGKIDYYENDEKVCTRRFVLKDIQKYSSTLWIVKINPNNNSDFSLYIHVSPPDFDSVIIDGYPYPHQSIDDSGRQSWYNNYFVKVE